MQNVSHLSRVQTMYYLFMANETTMYEYMPTGCWALQSPIFTHVCSWNVFFSSSEWIYNQGHMHGRVASSKDFVPHLD